MDIDFSVLATYIKPEVFILIPVLYVVGILLGQTPRIPKWFFSWIKLIIAYISCLFILGNNINAFIQAVLITGASVFLKDLATHTVSGMMEIKNSNDDKKE